MKNYYRIASIPAILGFIAFIAFNVIGSKIAPDGTLIEPFYLIPIGFLLIGMSVLSLAILWVYSLIRGK